MSKVVSVSESWGPLRCDVAGCGEPAYDVALSNADYLLILVAVGRDGQDGVGNDGIYYMLQKHLGVPACETHRAAAMARVDQPPAMPEVDVPLNALETGLLLGILDRWYAEERMFPAAEALRHKLLRAVTQHKRGGTAP